MADLTQPDEKLNDLSTHWPEVTDPQKFVLRYAPAIRGYLATLLPSRADVDDVVQEFLLSVCERGFAADRVRRGRFRDYLMAAVRYQAWRYLRRMKSQSHFTEQAVGLQVSEADAAHAAEWLAGWRQCLLDRAWDVLEVNERQSPGNWHHTALKLRMHHPDADSNALAAQVDASRPISAAAFRKQLSRARAAFAQALIDDVKRTLKNPTPPELMEELADLGLLEYVRSYLKNSGAT